MEWINGLWTFTGESKKRIRRFYTGINRLILERDGYKCVIWGRTEKEGYELHVDHILPKDKGEKATLRKWAIIVFSMQLKKNYNQKVVKKYLLDYGKPLED
jgi:5-methylcytosine-specific restriction endonuclease McrA